MYSPPSDSGLLPICPGCKREDYPLLNAKVHYDLSDVQMLANLTQTYTSNASVDSEIRYVFPLPSDASVCAFKAVIDGERTIKGIVKEKAKAKAEYDQAVAQGKTAALLEQGNVEIFQVSLGNIRPQQTIEVHISFVSVVSHDGSLDSIRLTFPTVIAPRYGAPLGGMLPSFEPSGYNNSKDALDFSVAVEMSSHIKSITSPSHPIAMTLGEATAESPEEIDPKKARVHLSSPTLLEKDIVLVLSCQGLDHPRCMVESFSLEEGGEEHTDAYALTLVPRFDLPPLPTQEYIFLVDRSGSMSGGKIEAVRSALQILLMSLPSRGTCFNIMSFGSRHSSLWPSSLTYSAESVKSASAHVDSMAADYGGTEIREAIEAAFARRAARPNGKTTSTSVFILTDGQAYDLDGVQSVIQGAVAKAKAEGLLLRVFCMGIGDAVSKAMCDVIARAGHGTTAFVTEEEKPDQKLMGLLRAARGAAVEDISIDWSVGEDDTPGTDNQDFEIVSPQQDDLEPPKPAAPISLFDESNTTSSQTTDLGPQDIHVKLPPPPRVQQAPSTKSLPSLYPGFRTSLFAIVRRGNGRNITPSKSVSIRGSALGRPVVLEVPVIQTSKSTAETPIKMLHSLAARALIQSIEDSAAAFMSEEDKAEVLRLAERYGLASSQTSFVAVDEQDKPIHAVHDVVQTGKAEEEEGGSNLKPKAKKNKPGGGDLLRKSYAGSMLGFGGDRGGPSRPRPTGSLRGKASAAPAPSRPVESVPHGGATPDLTSSASFGAVPTENVSSDYISELKLDNSVPLKSGKMLSFFKRSGKKNTTMTKSATSSSSPPPSIETFARAQSFDGSFTGSASLFQLLVRQSRGPPIPSTLEGSGVHKETVWCTILCIAYLETNFVDDKEVWMVLVEKAMAFVEYKLQDMGTEFVPEIVKDLKQAALKFIAQ